MTPNITSGSSLDVSSRAVYHIVSHLSLEYLVVGAVDAYADADADEKNQYSKTGGHSDGAR